MLSFERTLYGFRNSYGTEVRVTCVNRGGRLEVEVDGCTEDGFDKGELKNFLEQKGVMQNSDDYRQVGFNDTDGATYQDDTFSRLIFEKR